MDRRTPDNFASSLNENSTASTIMMTKNRILVGNKRSRGEATHVTI